MSNNNKSNLGAPLSVVRQQLLDDPSTREIAKAFKIPVEKYIEMVLKYAQNPDLEPELTILDEDEIQTHGEVLPTENEVVAWLEQVANGEIDILHPQTSTQDVVEKASPSQAPSKFTGGSVKKKPVKGQPFRQDLSSASVLKKQVNQRRAQKNLTKKTKPVAATADN